MPAPELPFDPSEIGAAVFDYGGVLIDGGPREVAAFGERAGIDAEAWRELRRTLFGNVGPWASLERGELDFDSFIDELAAVVNAAGGTVTREQALGFLGDPDPMAQKARLRADMLDRVEAIRGRVPTALLTNNVAEWRAGWRTLLDLDRLFDVVVDSSAVGTRKPESKIYEITRERLGVEHDAIFFLDDIGQNLKAARALGWKTVLFTQTDEILPVLDAIAAG